jgi:hypothetical protein
VHQEFTSVPTEYSSSSSTEDNGVKWIWVIGWTLIICCIRVITSVSVAIIYFTRFILRRVGLHRGVSDVYGDTISFQNARIRAHEWSAYLEDDVDLSLRLKANMGINFSLFNVDSKTCIRVGSLVYRLDIY